MQTIDEKRAYNRARYHKNREAGLERAKRYAKNNRDKVKSGYLRRNYGIDKVHYDMMREAQGFRCKICGRHEQDLGYELRVDHQHVENYENFNHGKKIHYIRGLLCDMCNLGISYFGDSPDRLEVARIYLIERNKYGGV